MQLQLKMLSRISGVVGLMIVSLGILLYAAHGFSPYSYLYWLIGCAGLVFWAFNIAAGPQPAAMPHEIRRGISLRRIDRRDWLLLGVLLLVFTPLYLYKAQDFPRQMNTDEISIMSTEQHVTSIPNADLFGPSYYADLPTFIFWMMGKAGLMLGGITLGHMRTLHATSGVVIILLCFGLLRMLKLARSGAFVGAAVIGLNHSLFMISRMAMRDNTALLFELITLLLLLYGWQRRSYGWTLLGGLMGGLTFYTYYPSRITMCLWLAFVAAATIISRFRDWKMAAKLSLMAISGVIIIVTPLYIANSKHVPTDQYATQQFLWQKAGRAQEMEYRGTATTRQAVIINIEHGLLAFNKPYSDEGMIYDHPGYGFVDELTGLLLWAGVAAVIIQSIRRRSIGEADMLVLGSFLIIWLSMAFLLTRAPDYTRLLTVLPFLGYLVARAVGACSSLAERQFVNPRLKQALPWLIAVVAVLAVAGANYQIAKNFWQDGNISGDGVGDTLRFQDSRGGENLNWLFVPGDTAGYYSQGIPSYWTYWFDFGVAPGQTTEYASQQQLIDNAFTQLTPGQQGYLMTTGKIWTMSRSYFSSYEHVISVTVLDKADNRVAVRYSEP
jgi:hypothetical protein